MPATCGSPLTLDALVDYWAESSSAAQQELVEDHVFNCSSCSRRLAEVAALARAVAEVAARRGGLQMIATPSLIERLVACGVTMREYRAEPEQLVACTVGVDDDLLVTYLSADLHDVARADLVLKDADGRALLQIEDTPIDRAHNRIVFTIAGELARTFPAMTFVVELVAVAPAERRTVARYRFQHTPGA